MNSKRISRGFHMRNGIPSTAMEERHTLLAVLISAKIGLNVQTQAEADQALGILSGFSAQIIQRAVQQLSQEYGVLEWNERFLRYEIIGDAVPRSDFTRFLRQKTAKISLEQSEEIFAMQMKNWAGLDDIDPEFASAKQVSTTEWRFQVTCSHGGRIHTSIANAIQDWKKAIATDAYRGQLIFYYLPADSNLEEHRNFLQNVLDNTLTESGCPPCVPLGIIVMHDQEGKLKQALGELWVLSGHFPLKKIKNTSISSRNFHQIFVCFSFYVYYD